MSQTRTEENSNKKDLIKKMNQYVKISKALEEFRRIPDLVSKAKISSLYHFFAIKHDFSNIEKEVVPEINKEVKKQMDQFLIEAIKADRTVSERVYRR